jgi:PAS domain S-box-containing protein
VKAQLRTTVEQYETQAEAAQAANEELQALNVELRSVAEELETSKEELQAVNEELTTVNQELKIKIEELGVTNNDFQNLINSTDIGTIFLDRNLRVKLYTAHAQQVFNLVEEDVGRQLSDITSHLFYDDVHQDVRRVLATLATVEQEVRTRDGRVHLMRLRPYRTADNRIEGVVLTFHDITTRRDAELRSRQADERLRLLIESAIDYAIFTTAEDGRIESWNLGAERLFGYTAEDVVGRPIDILFTEEDRAAGVPQLELETARRTGRAADERYHVRKDGTRFYVSGTTTRIGEGGLGFAKIARDLTGQQQAEEALHGAHGQLEQRVKERTHDLEAEKAVVTDLVGRIVSAQEEERARIARDLHDSMGQQMTALRLSLERHAERCPLGSSDRGMTDALALTATVGDQMDFLAHQLRPSALEDLGLASALPRFVQAWSEHAGIAAEFRTGDFEVSCLSADVETTFYRIAQEALNNVVTHAHASRVDVLLATRDGFAVMVIEDDGIGFDPSQADIKRRGMGLATMRERAALVGAALDIESEAGRGTSLYLRAPLKTA